MRGHIIGYVETPGVGDNSYEGEVEFTGVDAEIEEEDMEMTDMETEGKFQYPRSGQRRARSIPTSC